MSVLRWRLLPTLGATLARLAALVGAPAYADHYARDLAGGAAPSAATGPDAAAAAAAVGGGDGGGAAGAAGALGPPPDMFRALQALLAGQRDGGAAAAPLLARQRAPCVRRSADLLAAYGLLAEAAASLAASLSLEAAQVREEAGGLC